MYFYNIKNIYFKKFIRYVDDLNPKEKKTIEPKEEDKNRKEEIIKPKEEEIKKPIGKTQEA